MVIMHRAPVVIIDDDPLCCEFVDAALGRAGYEVLSAHDGVSGIEMARSTLAGVILLDMVMAGMDGIATCRRLKQDPGTREIPVIAITAALDSRYAEEAHGAGAEFFVPKPLTSENLICVVKLALDASHANPLRRPRLYARFRVDLPMRCTLGKDGETGREVMAYAGDVGSGGMLIWLPEMVVPGTVLHLRLRLPKGEVAAECQVVWQDYRAGSTATPYGVRIIRFLRKGDQLKYRQFLHQLKAKGGI